MPTCWQCRAESPRAHWLRVAENKTALYGPWEGWRMAGRYLITPTGNRITPERLAGMMWEESMRLRAVTRGRAAPESVTVGLRPHP